MKAIRAAFIHERGTSQMCYRFICQVNKSEQEDQTQAAYVAITIEKEKEQSVRKCNNEEGGCIE